MTTATLTVTLELDDCAPEQKARLLYRAAIEIENHLEAELNKWGWVAGNNVGIKSCRADYDGVEIEKEH